MDIGGESEPCFSAFLRDCAFLFDTWPSNYASLFSIIQVAVVWCCDGTQCLG